MASVYDDAVLDFDLNFLRQTSNNTANLTKLEKQKKAVALVKKKIIATNSLIGKFYAKRQELEESEKNLLVSKEECKQICIDYRNALEACAKLESDINAIQNANKELEERFFHTDTQLEGVKSHANQLQGLVNEQKTKIESLEIENKLDKVALKDNEKKSLSLQKENDILRKNICIFRDIILKKKILTPKYKELLRKFDKPFADDDTDDHPPDEPDISDGEDDIFEDVPSPDSAMHSPEHFSENQKPAIVDEGATEFDRNEAASIDTGRGSSLAYSDNEKCIHSPEYFLNNSPPNKEILNDVKPQLVAITTRPIRSTAEIATSPIHSPNESLLCQVTLQEEDCSSNHPFETTQEPNTKDCTSVHSMEVDLSNSLSRSPFRTSKSIFSPERTAPNHEKNETQAKQCLELNKSSNDVEENSNDVEIATILNTMRLHEKLLTPIPPSPAKSIRDRGVLRPTSSLCKKIEYNGNYMCQDAVSIREENKKLQDSISDLAREMINIKSLLKSHLSSYQSLENSNKQDTIPKQVDIARNTGNWAPVSEQSHPIVDAHNQVHSTGNDTSNKEVISIGDCSSIDRELDSGKEFNVFNLVKQQNTEIIITDHDELVKDNNKPALISKSDLFGDDEDDEEIDIIVPLINEYEDTMPVESVEHEDIITFRPTPGENKDTMTVESVEHEDIITFRPTHAENEDTMPVESVEHEDIVTFRPTHDENEDAMPVESVEHEDIVSFRPTPGENEDTMPVESVEHEDIVSFRPTPDENEDTILCIPLLEEPNHNTCSEFAVQPLQTKMTILSTPQKVSDIPPTENEMAVQENSQMLPQRIQFEDSMPLPNISTVDSERILRSISTANISDINGPEVITKEPVTEECVEEHHGKAAKRKKLTNLQRLKKKLGPKYKIKTETTAPTPRKLRGRPKQLPSPKKKVITPSDTAASLNDKDVYEKAVKIMAELKSKKQITDSCEASKVTKPKINREPKLRESPDITSLNNGACSPRSTITTRSRRKCVEDSNDSPIKDIETNNNKEIVVTPPRKKMESPITVSPRVTRKRHSQPSPDISEVQCKRLLRSSVSSRNESEIPQKTPPKEKISPIQNNSFEIPKPSAVPEPDKHPTPVSYNDIDMFSAEDKCSESTDGLASKSNGSTDTSLKDNLLCKMIEKHGIQRVKNGANKAADAKVKSIYETIDSKLKRIISLPCNETKAEMDRFVAYIQTLNHKHFILGLMQYLTHAERKTELFSKVNIPPAPPMTKSEQVLLYVIMKLRNFWPSVDFADLLLCNIEYTLFKLNQTPEFDVIESLSHFYAVVCAYFKAKSRLRLFILDAMYCIQFKSVPLIKQCLEVWLHVLPLAHMGIAKTPLVTCLVYLLHFYKCEDRFNRVQDLRNLLKRKYFYQITEWNETKMLEMLREAIMDVKGIPIERKMLRLALIILAKRQGTRWCQNQAIKNVLMPILERDNVPERVKVFCVSLIGPLMKPYPDDMKVHCEIAMNQLVDLLEQSPSKEMEEAILTSLVYMSRHNNSRVIELLLSRKMTAMSKEFEDILRDFVREKPLRTWKTIVKKTLF